MSFESFMHKHPAAGAAGALVRILVLLGAFWLCVANTGAPCMEISEPKATGPVGIKIDKKGTGRFGTGEISFEISSPVTSFVLKQGPDLILEAVCREGAGNCIPKKIRVDCTLMTDASSGSPLATTEVLALAAQTDASGEADAADVAAETAGEKKITMNGAASKRCSEGGFFSSGKETVALAKTLEGKEGTLHFQARMISAPGYLSCNDDYKKCGESYK